MSMLIHRLLPVVALLCLLGGPIRGCFDVDGKTFYATVGLISTMILLLVGFWQLKFQADGTQQSS